MVPPEPLTSLLTPKTERKCLSSATPVTLFATTAVDSRWYFAFAFSVRAACTPLRLVEEDRCVEYYEEV